ncbi:hypothetical protein JOM56_006106 [Amanita muscaria]
MSLLREYTYGTLRSHHPLLLIQSSIAQSGVPLLRHIITGNNARQPTTSLVFCLLYRPSDLMEENVLYDHIKVYDWLGFVPGYNDSPFDVKDQILQAVREAPAGKLNVIVDSVDTLDGSSTETHKFIRTLLRLLQERHHPARLVLHVHQSSELVPLLTQVSLSPSLVHLTVHPSALLVHIAKEYLTPPPPSSSDAKFWSVFLPIRDRLYESINLVHDSRGEGSGHSTDMVVEVLVRGSNGANRRHGMSRVLEGWSITRKEPSELVSLESLKGIWRKVAEEAAPDPTQNVSFNLKLTPGQQESRAQVPLPYVLDNKPTQQPAAGAIIYDPDSADDIDDDDPDEDLDI